MPDSTRRGGDPPQPSLPPSDFYPSHDYDTDRGMCRRRAWFIAKNAFGPTAHGIRDLMTALEVVAPGIGHPRDLLAVGVFDFLRKHRPAQEHLVREWCDWWDRGRPLVLEIPSRSADKARRDDELRSLIASSARRAARG